MKKYYVEVGSTVTKIDTYDGKAIKRVKDVTILFKKNYSLNNNKLVDEDVDNLIKEINKLDSKDVFVYGTSIFRSLDDEQKAAFLKKFKDKTGFDFTIVSSQEEGKYTILGAIHNTLDRVCVFNGGGGSCEIAICDKGKIEKTYNFNIGVIDALKSFPDLSLDIAKTSLDKVLDYVNNNIKIDEDNVDYIILAGGGHEKFARLSGINYEDNTLYEDVNAPIMMDIKTRIKDTEDYFNKVSLDSIKEKVSDPSWWDATRAMAAFALAVAQKTNAKYVVPTDIAMVHGLVLK